MLNRWITRVLLALIGAYRAIVSPLLGPTCRYVPSCSAYAATAIERFGPVRGTRMGIGRICRCHPWAKGGDDPVPSVSSAPNADEPVLRSGH